MLVALSFTSSASRDPRRADVSGVAWQHVHASAKRAGGDPWTRWPLSGAEGAACRPPGGRQREVFKVSGEEVWAKQNARGSDSD